MKEIFLYLFIFVFVYLFYVIFVYRRKNVFKKFPEGKEMGYLKYKYNVKVNDSNIKKISQSVFIANSFILSTTVTVVSLFDNLVLEIFIGAATLLILILISYHILGKIYGRR